MELFTNIYLKALYDFLLLFLMYYIVYTVFLNKKRRKYSDIGKTDEIRYFILRYDLDMRKTKYEVVLKLVTLINSFILAFTTAIVINIDKIIWAILVGFAVIMILIYSLYEIVGRYLKKKEMVKDV